MPDSDVPENTVSSFKKATEFLQKNFQKIVLFIIMWVFIILIIKLTYNSSVQRAVRENSRCNSKSDVGQTIFKVIGSSMSNKDIFTVTYNLLNKDYTIEQICPVGSVINKVSIPVYNMSKMEPEYIEKIFSCEQNFDLDGGNNIMYKGDGELVRFMQFQNTDFFEKKLL